MALISFIINEKPGKFCYLLSSQCWPNNYVIQFHCDLNLILDVEWQNQACQQKKKQMSKIDESVNCSFYPLIRP